MRFYGIKIQNGLTHVAPLQKTSFISSTIEFSTIEISISESSQNQTKKSWLENDSDLFMLASKFKTS